MKSVFLQSILIHNITLSKTHLNSKSWNTTASYF